MKYDTGRTITRNPWRAKELDRRSYPFPTFSRKEHLLWH
jgi:hypothetical protein